MTKRFGPAVAEVDLREVGRMVRIRERARAKDRDVYQPFMWNCNDAIGSHHARDVKILSLHDEWVSISPLFRHNSYVSSMTRRSRFAIVGLGTIQPATSPQNRLLSTLALGFVIPDLSNNDRGLACTVVILLPCFETWAHTNR